MMRPLVLLTNDDGIDAPGIAALAAALAGRVDVVAAAPERERSAVSHSITLHKPLRIAEVRPGWFSVSGTPVDSVYAGLLSLAPRPPALVVSGINRGFNLGSDVFYSGTVAAAGEAALRGVAAIAVSHDVRGTPELAAEFTAELVRLVLAHGVPARTVLNVNVPKKTARQFSWTRLGDRRYRDRVEERSDLRGRTYFWIGGPAEEVADEAGTDGEAVRRGMISITPLRMDWTAHDQLVDPPDWPVDGYELWR